MRGVRDVDLQCLRDVVGVGDGVAVVQQRAVCRASASVSM